MLARLPVANENEMTPKIMRKQAKAFSPVVSGVMSPYPTVVIVVTVK